MVSKNHLKGAGAVILTAALYFGGAKFYHFIQAVNKLTVLAEEVAKDQKTGQTYTVVDVLEAVAQEKLLQLQQQQKAAQGK